MKPGGDNGLTVHDVVGLAFAALCLLWTISAEVLIAPVFLKMFADYGGRLPTLTILCLSWSFPAIMGVLPLAMTLTGILGRAGRETRVLAMVASILLSVMAPAIFMLGMYLPLWRIASEIK